MYTTATKPRVGRLAISFDKGNNKETSHTNEPKCHTLPLYCPHSVIQGHSFNPCQFSLQFAY